MGNLKIIKASAGSGKTYRLVWEYIRLVINNPYRYRNILAVTFTNKATNEMKSRILQQLDLLASGEGMTKTMAQAGIPEGIATLEERKTEIVRRATLAQSLILHDYSRFSVMTIDKFFQKILRAFFRELGIENGYKVKLNDTYYLSLATDALLDQLSQDNYLKQWIEEISSDRAEEGKKNRIRNELLKIAGRIFDPEFDREFYLQHTDELKTFFSLLRQTREAMEDEISEAAQAFLNTCVDFSLCENDFYQRKRGAYGYVAKTAKGDFSPYNNYVQQSLEPDSKFGTMPQPLKERLRKELQEVCEKRDRHAADMATIGSILKNYREVVVAAEIAGQLDKVCRSNNVLLLTGSMRLISSLINNNDTPYIYEKTGIRYDIIMIDEFQDTSAVQWRNFAPLVANTLAVTPPTEEAVTLVGDVKQSMYRWRGGDWRLLESGIGEFIPADRLLEESLTTNWRSREQIVRFNNAICTKLSQVINCKLNKILEDKEALALPESFSDRYRDLLKRAYADVCQTAQQTQSGGYVEVMRYDASQNENLDRLVETIADLQKRGYRAGDIAILVRTKKEIPAITNRLLQAKKNEEGGTESCYDFVAQEGLLLNNAPAVQFVLGLFTLSINANDSVAAAVVSLFLLGSETAAIPQEDTDFIASLSGFSACEAFEKICERFPLYDNRQQTAFLEGLHDCLIEFSKEPISDIPKFLEWWNNDGHKTALQTVSPRNAITIETVHSAKGLEFPVVILPKCDWQMPPKKSSLFWGQSSQQRYNAMGKMLILWDDTAANSYFRQDYLNEYLLDYIENFNVFYVAVTRAVGELYLMIPQKSALQLRTDLMECFEEKEGQVTITETLTGTIAEDRYCFGQKTTAPTAEQAPEETLLYPAYFSADYRNRIVLPEKYAGYFSAEDTYRKRKAGILMHKLFEKIRNISQIDKAIRNLVTQGDLAQEDVPEIRKQLEIALRDPLVASWFSDNWHIKTEIGILESKGADGVSIYRPDRVVWNEEKTIIIDYKFGEGEQSGYRRQVSNYARLLAEMGHRNIEGYLWYFHNGTIERVL